jgi:hypothetical protein
LRNRAIAAASTEAGGHAGRWVRYDVHVRSDKCENVVDRGDTVAGDFLIEELGFLFVDGRGRQRNETLAVIEGSEFNPKELDASDDGGAATSEFAGVYVKHQFLRLAPPAPENSGGGVQNGSL